jgi:hypothetical protein
MKSAEHQDRLVDMLLSGFLGGETPPDVLTQVLEAAEKLPSSPVHQPLGRRLTVVRSARKSRTPILAAAAAAAAQVGSIVAFLVFQEIADTRTPTLTGVQGTVNHHSAGPVRPGETLGTELLSVLLKIP